MSKLVRSTIEPETISIDVVKNGSVRLLCHWDISAVEVTDEDLGTHTEYEYLEEVLWWTLPSPSYLERVGAKQVMSAAGESYLASTETEILNWAKAAGV